VAPATAVEDGSDTNAAAAVETSEGFCETDLVAIGGNSSNGIEATDDDGTDRAAVTVEVNCASGK